MSAVKEITAYAFSRKKKTIKEIVSREAEKYFTNMKKNPNKQGNPTKSKTSSTGVHQTSNIKRTLSSPIVSLIMMLFDDFLP